MTTSRVVSVYGTELEFLQRFIAEITAASDRIVCTTSNLAAQFESTSNTPYFELKIDGYWTVKFERNGALTGSQAAYKVYTDISGSSEYTGQLIAHSTSTTSYSTKTARTWKFTVRANDTAVFLRIASYNANLSNPQSGNSTTREIDFLFLKNGDAKAGAFNTIYNATGHSTVMTAPFYVHSGETIVTASAFEKFGYTYDSQNQNSIEVIGKKSFVTASTTERLIDFSALIDCSNVSAEQIFTVGDKKYYSISTNTLMEV